MADLSAAALARYKQWQYDARARDAVPTRMPSGPYKGQLAERTGTRAPFVYTLAPRQVRADDLGIAVGLVVDKIAGKAADAVTGTVTTVKSAAQTVLEAPRAAAGAVLGIPKWAVTAIVLAGAAFVAYRISQTTTARR